ncbi:MAG TPA: D-glycero-beta-D-manno-heptose-7-phosphate kinase [Armatimonadetes bacterium]|nr:D-glycero-beta-D-manno-heptose-7-phosphate kinase [Armatimonadota bacterium]
MEVTPHNDVNMQSIAQILSRFGDTTILVIGDLMLDEYIVGVAQRISPEAPVPVLLRRERRIGPGGAANVAWNVASLGAKVYVAGAVGADDAATELKQLLADLPANIAGVVTDPTRPTTLKTRIIAHQQQVVRIDTEEITPLSDEVSNALLSAVQPLLDDVDAILVSDYAKGVVTESLLATIRDVARRRDILLTAGPKPCNLNAFHEFDFVSFNTTEASEAAMLNHEPVTGYREIGVRLATRLNVRGLVITRGDEGASLFTPTGWLCDIPAYRVTVYDVAGAGDTYLATLTLALATGADFVTAGRIANAAAAAVVRKAGVAPVTIDEIHHVMEHRWL